MYRLVAMGLCQRGSTHLEGLAPNPTHPFPFLLPLPLSFRLRLSRIPTACPPQRTRTLPILCLEVRVRGVSTAGKGEWNCAVFHVAGQAVPRVPALEMVGGRSIYLICNAFPWP